MWGSRAHRAQRLRVFARDGYRCRWPGGCTYRDDTESGLGLVADHVDGIDEQRAFDDDELQTLCLHHSGVKDGQR